MMGRYDGRVRSTLFSTRHLGRSALVVLVVSLALSGLLGVAAAGERPYGLEGSLFVPAPAVGDRAEYGYSVVQVGENGTRFIRDEVIGLGFEWLMPEDTLDAHGEARRANVLEMFRASSFGRAFHCHAEGWREAGSGRYFLEPETNRLIASQGDREQSRSASPEPLQTRVSLEVNACPRPALGHSREATPEAPLKVTGTRGTGFYLESEAPHREMPCLLSNSLQGRQAVLDRSVHLFEPPCRLDDFVDFALPYRIHDMRFHAAGWEEIDGRTCIVYLHHGSWQERVLPFQSTQPVYVWICEGVPYPVRMAIAISPRVHFSGDAEALGPRAYSVYRLVSFARGTGPLTTDSQPLQLASAPPLEYSARQPWGLDDSGVNHHFLLSRAWKQLAEDPVSPAYAFLQDHPEAYALNAGYVELKNGDATERRWTLRIAGTDAVLFVDIVQRIDAGRAEYRYETPHFVEQGGIAQGSTLPPSALPAEVPTVASLAAFWKHYAGEGFRHDSFNSWHFLFENLHDDCRPEKKDDCTLHLVSLDFGFSAREETDLDALPSERRSLLSIFAPDGQLRVRALFEVHSFVTTSWSPPPRVEDDSFGVLSFGEYEPALWRFPPARLLIGGGLAALIAGLLYWASPLLKAPFAGPLFTRVQPAAALQHPARAQLAALIESTPGIHQREIQRRLGLAFGSVRHHLRTLEHVGLVARFESGGYACYFPPGRLDRRVMQAAPVLKSEGARTVLQLAVDRPGLSLREIASAGRLSVPTVHRHVRRLEKVQLVRFTRAGRKACVEPTEIARFTLDALSPSPGQGEDSPA